MTKEIQETFIKYLLAGSYTSMCENFDYRGWEFDIAALNTTGKLCEYEVKISRQDFMRDKKKSKWIAFKSKNIFVLPHYFSYVCPSNLISIAEIPSYSGLFYYDDGWIKCIRSPKRIHNFDHDVNWILNKMLRLTIERKYLGASKMTIRNRQLSTTTP